MSEPLEPLWPEDRHWHHVQLNHYRDHANQLRNNAAMDTTEADVVTHLILLDILRELREGNAFAQLGEQNGR